MTSIVCSELTTFFADISTEIITYILVSPMYRYILIGMLTLLAIRTIYISLDLNSIAISFPIQAVLCVV